MKEKKTSKERAEDAATLWKSGKNAKEISEIMGLSRDYTLWLLSFCEDYKNRPNENELRKKRVQEYYESGKSVKEIAEIEGISKNQAYSIINKLRLKPPSVDKKISMAMPDGWEWKWPLVTNRLLKTGHKPLHKVPTHSKQAEKAFWRAK